MTLILDNGNILFTLSFYFEKHHISASSSLSLQFNPIKLSILNCQGFTAGLYRIEAKLSKIQNKMARNRHSGIRNVQESRKLSRINQQWIRHQLSSVLLRHFSPRIHLKMMIKIILKVSTCYTHLSIPLKSLKILSSLIKMY